MLIPWYGLAGVFVLTTPIAALLAVLASANIAVLFVATAMFYMLSYELLHLAWHLPPDGVSGRLPLVARLRRHHATHHRPELMRRFNFNVTIPLGDYLQGTVWRDDRQAAPSAMPSRAERYAKPRRPFPWQFATRPQTSQ